MPARKKPSRTKSKKKAGKRTTRIVRARFAPRTSVVEKPVVVALAAAAPVADEITEQTVIRTEPEVEVRKPATLAQALTERAEVVVKPKTRVLRKEVKHRHIA
jgi:hypothetical protein